MCPYCYEKTSNYVSCERCANQLKNLVNVKSGSTKDCYSFTAPFIYKDIVRDAILTFKFEKKIEYCKSFCYFIKACNTYLADILVYVPNNDGKFNSSKEIAKILKRKLKIKLQNNAITKVKKTKCQHNCNFKERYINLNGAFIANEKKVRGKTILICDDIITTASTMQEMASALKKSGALKVFGIAFAISENSKNYNLIKS